MKNRSGFVLYEAIFVFAILSLLGIVYLITLRSNEFLYYKELARQRTVGFTDYDLCGGPSGVSCEEGYTCEITSSRKNAFGNCISI